MIRCIDLGTQTSDGPRQFAFWNTVSDQFLHYNGAEAWAKRETLQQDLVWHLGSEQAVVTLQRLNPLIPDWAK
jgi:hypothetical protein